MDMATSKASSDQNSQKPESKTQIFILSGQSNMSGHGGVIKQPQPQHWDGVVPPECHPHASILRFSAALKWEQANEPIHADIDSAKICGVGPGMALANVLRRRVDGTLGLVPCARGGTAIKEWARGEQLYENMIKRAKESLKGDGKREIKALFWYQGESDALSEDVAKAYKANMEKFIHNVREDLNLPSLPIIQVALASGPSGEEANTEIVREAQKSINLPNVVCVDAKGLPLKEDNLHLTTESQVQLGRMLADAYLTHFVAAH